MFGGGPPPPPVTTADIPEYEEDGGGGKRNVKTEDIIDKDAARKLALKKLDQEDEEISIIIAYWINRLN